MSINDALNNRYIEPVRRRKKKKAVSYEKVPRPVSDSPASPGRTPARNRAPLLSSSLAPGYDAVGPSMDDVQVHKLGPLPVKGKVKILFLHPYAFLLKDTLNRLSTTT